MSRGEVRTLDPLFVAPARLVVAVRGAQNSGELSVPVNDQRVIPVDGVDDLVRFLEPVSSFLQCAAVAGCDDADRARLARLGVSRLCPPGRMGTPTMVWHHDGEGCLASLVRWCDEETRMPS